MAFALSPFSRVRVAQYRPRFRGAWHGARFVCAAAKDSHRVVFLGTPNVAASSLKRIHAAAIKSSDGPSSDRFHIAAVVSQPPAPVGRKRILTSSPVHALAMELGVSEILTPASARNPQFLEQLAAIEPDLCITAAYGNFLPQEFLDIPRFGTLNIHPSLLPKFRGAAPVPRAIEAGLSTTGVSVAYTELKMDSGPILTQTRLELNGSEQAPDVLQNLFDVGTDSLIEWLPAVFRGDASAAAQPQDDSEACHAPKLSKDDARVPFNENAVRIHDKVRALAGWPGTWADFDIEDIGEKGSMDTIRLKIMSSVVLRAEGGMCLGVHEVKLTDDKLIGITCDDGSMLGLETVQPPGKKPMSAESFWNGLRGRRITRKRVPH